MGIKCWLHGHDYAISCDRCSRCGQPEPGGHDWYVVSQHLALHKCRRCRETRDTVDVWSTCRCSQCERLRTAPIGWFVDLLSKNTDAEYHWFVHRGVYQLRGDTSEKPVALTVLEGRLKSGTGEVESHDLWKAMLVPSTHILVEPTFGGPIERRDIRTDAVNALARNALVARFGKVPPVEQVTPHFGEAVTFYVPPPLVASPLGSANLTRKRSDLTFQASMSDWEWFSRKSLEGPILLPDGKKLVVDKEYAAARTDGTTCVVFSGATDCWLIAGHPNDLFVLFAHRSKDPALKFDRRRATSIPDRRSEPRWYELVHIEPNFTRRDRHVVLTENATTFFDGFRFAGSELFATEFLVADDGELTSKTVAIDLITYEKRQVTP